MHNLQFTPDEPISSGQNSGSVSSGNVSSRDISSGTISSGTISSDQLQNSGKVQNAFKAKQLPALLSALQNKRVSGVLKLGTKVNQRLYQRLLVLDHGHFVYGGSALPTAAEIANMLKQQAANQWINVAISSTLENEGTELTPHAMISRLVAMHLVTWEKVETLCLEQIAMVLELFLPLPGQFSFQQGAQPSLIAGFDLNQAMTAVQQRRSRWSTLPFFPDGMSTVPHRSPKALRWLESEHRKKSGDGSAIEELLSWIDEQQSIVEIGAAQRRDPLIVAQQLLPAFEQGWLVTDKEFTPTSTHQPPTILVVDDSDVMRQLIQRILSDRYRVVLASTAIEALGLLDREPISMLLLDVSMPGIDGLELCRSVRNMSRFRNLPIVMVTGRDGFFDKVKGRMAGATEYLTKPFENQQLISLVREYVHTNSSKAMSGEMAAPSFY
jgi:CheY-like chemotaxis protein